MSSRTYSKQVEMDVDASAELEVPTKRVVTRAYEDLLCTLTIEERLERATRLAGILEDIQNENSQQEDEKRAMKSRIAALEAQLHQMQLVVSRGRESRSVEVESVADYAVGKLFRIRQDTGEVIGERGLTPDEAQMSFTVTTSGSVEVTE